MAEIKVDTGKLSNCGKEIMELSNDLNESFDGLFNRIDNILTETHEWTGDAAIKFVEKIDKEKIDYFEMKDTIYAYGKYIESSAEELDKAIIKNSYGG